MRRAPSVACGVLALALYAHAKQNYYLEGEGGRVQMEVTTLTSRTNVIPYSWDYLEYGCNPTVSEEQADNIGEILWGQVRRRSNYIGQLRSPTEQIEASCSDPDLLRTDGLCCARIQTVQCIPLCRGGQRGLSEEQQREWKRFIELGYRGNMILDDLPLLSDGRCYPYRQVRDDVGDAPSVTGCSKPNIRRGFPVGQAAGCGAAGSANSDVTHTEIYNHLAFTIEILQQGGATWGVVGFWVTPYSIDHDTGTDEELCDDSLDLARVSEKIPAQTVQLANISGTRNITFSYSVRWRVREDLTWEQRWDAYTHLGQGYDSAIRWFSIINSLVAILMAAGIVTFILMRTLHRDFNRYNNPENEEEMQEEVGWKLVHADVFRAPRWPQLFCIVVGSGVHVLLMVIVTVVFLVLSLIRPVQEWGTLIQRAIVLFVILSFFNGYTVGTLQNMFGAKKWKTVFVSGMLISGIYLGMWVVAQIALAAEDAVSAVEFKYWALLFFCWMVVTFAVVLGACVAYKRAPIEPPVRVQRIARQIPTQRWYMNSFVLFIGVGAIPFLAAFIELMLIFSSIWEGYVLHLFGFLFLVLFLTLTMTALSTVFIVYNQLVFEDYRWWWTSLAPSGFGLWFVLVSVYNLIRFQSRTAYLLYFEGTIGVSIILGLCAGVVGFFTTWKFVTMIYSSIKVD
eukprot:Hpha_TRINITY_DN16911_c4_g1::TRINITY_DN16911_c4_g1_i1::g.52378::m.52378/K17086/TM9SF2_4; transmembrane 9 superfamily member 2/4